MIGDSHICLKDIIDKIMIQKRYKQTEKLAEAQALKELLVELPVLLAEIPLPGITAMPHHNQVLRVRDINVAICANYVGITPRRILIDKESGEEIDLNLFVPKWEIGEGTVNDHIDNNGNKQYYEMEWFDDETNEVVASKPVVIGQTEEGEDIVEDEVLPILEDEVFELPTIPYTMYLTKQILLPDLIEIFSKNFIAINTDVWTKIKE